MSTRFPNIGDIQVKETLQNRRVIAAIFVFIGLAVFPSLGMLSETFLVLIMMCFAIVALGFNVLLGYTGLLSFGHAAFFGGAAYAVAIGSAEFGIESLLLLVAFGVAVAGVLGVLIGVLSLRSHEIYFALLTLALAQLLWVIAVRDIYSLTGGTDGMSVVRPDFLGTGVNDLAFNTYIVGFYYYIVLLFLAAVVIFLWYVLRSPFGLTLKMIRENPERAELTGVPVKRYRLYAFVLSAMITGLGGALYAVQLGRITPDQMHWIQSGEIVFMTLLGGIGTFIGPAVGALGFIALEEFALRYTEYWHFTMGVILFVVVVTLRERGVWGGLKDLPEFIEQRRGNE